jgi:hypothetical protein
VSGICPAVQALVDRAFCDQFAAVDQEPAGSELLELG